MKTDPTPASAPLPQEMNDQPPSPLHQRLSDKIRLKAFPIAKNHHLLPHFKQLIETAQGMIYDEPTLQRSIEKTRPSYQPGRRRLLHLLQGASTFKKADAVTDTELKSLANWLLLLAAEELAGLQQNKYGSRVSAAMSIEQPQSPGDFANLQTSLDGLLFSGLQPDEAMMQKERDDERRQKLDQVLAQGEQKHIATVTAVLVRKEKDLETRGCDVVVYSDVAKLPAAVLTKEIKSQDEMTQEAVRKSKQRALEKWIGRVAVLIATCYLILSISGSREVVNIMLSYSDQSATLPDLGRMGGSIVGVGSSSLPRQSVLLSYSDQSATLPDLGRMGGSIVGVGSSSLPRQSVLLSYSDQSAPLPDLGRMGGSIVEVESFSRLASQSC